MSLLKVFTIYDSKAETYLIPFYARANGEAIRTFINMAKDDTHPVGQNPEDYTLFRIGMFDQEKGIVAGLKAHEPLGKAIDYIREPDPNRAV